jgi:hypothetical protein
LHSLKMFCIIFPKSLRSGADLMSNIVVRNPEFVEIITRAFVNSQDDYVLEESEWNNETRSDLVLEPKFFLANLSSIVVKFQHLQSPMTCWLKLPLLCYTDEDEMSKGSIEIILPKYYTFINDTSRGCIYILSL